MHIKGHNETVPPAAYLITKAALLNTLKRRWNQKDYPEL